VIAAGGAIGGFMGERGEGFELAIKRWLLGHEGAL
jgi:O6-methylguanine-DNA--protein-cysteine methyltransferase